MDISKIVDKLKSSPKLITYLAVALVCTVLLLLMNLPSGSDSSDDDSKPVTPDTEYKEVLEKELEEIISKIEGVGKVTVMLTVDSTYSYEYVTDVSDKDSETVIIGNKEALVARILNPKISGVLVVCSGGDSVKIKEKVIESVSTVLDIPRNKVYVAKHNN